MKQTLITTGMALGLLLGSFSHAFASTATLAMTAQNSTGSRQLNPQPEPPGVTEAQSMKGKNLNPQPEPPGTTEQKVSTSTMTCVQTAENTKKMAIAASKIAYSNAIQAATEAKLKAMDHAKTLTDKAPKKAAILKAQSDFSNAIIKARKDKSVALASANQAYKNAINACKNPTSR